MYFCCGYYKVLNNRTLYHEYAHFIADELVQLESTINEQWVNAMNADNAYVNDYALKKANVSADCCAMVGDTIRTDILGGFNAGMKTVLILGYGVTQDKLDEGETLEEVVKKEGATPDYILKGLK